MTEAARSSAAGVRLEPEEALAERRRGDRDLLAAGLELGERRHARRLDAVVAQHVQQGLAAALAAKRAGADTILMERYGCESVRVRAAKPEPPLPLAIQEIAVEITQERAVDDDGSDD